MVECCDMSQYKAGLGDFVRFPVNAWLLIWSALSCNEADEAFPHSPHLRITVWPRMLTMEKYHKV